MPRLILAGPYEFLADDPFLYGHLAGSAKNTMPAADDARLALAAYTILNVDLGWLSKKASQWFTSNTGNVPPGFLTVDAAPISRMVETAAGTIGVVLFPEGPVPGKEPTAKQEEAVLSAARSMQGRVRLILGISPWGFVGERNFLPKAEGVFNCILGSGEGVGFPYTISTKNPGVLWIRPDGSGRAINVVELYALPEPGQSQQWIERKTFHAGLEFLDAKCPSDPGMLRLLGTPLD